MLACSSFKKEKPVDGGVVLDRFPHITFPDMDAIVFMAGILRLKTDHALELSSELVEAFRKLCKEGMFELNPHLQNNGQIIYHLSLCPKAIYPHLLITACRLLDPYQTWSAKVFFCRQYISLQGENFSLVIPTDYLGGRFKYIVWERERASESYLILEGLLHDEKRFSIRWGFNLPHAETNLSVKATFFPVKDDPGKYSVHYSIEGNISDDRWPYEIFVFVKEVLGNDPQELSLRSGSKYSFDLKSICQKAGLRLWLTCFARIRKFILTHGQLAVLALTTVYNDFLIFGSITGAVVCNKCWRK
jgi:hypothetical protein